MSYSYIPNSVDEPQPLETKPPWLLRFLREISIFFGLVFLLFLAFSLASYSPQDPAWSTSGDRNLESIRNWLGATGAILSDVLYFCLGAAVWALFGFLCLRWLAAVRKLKAAKVNTSSTDTLPEHGHSSAFWGVLFGRYLGLTVLLSSTCALLWSRAYDFDMVFPIGAGGALGHWLGGMLQALLGFNGLTIALLPIWVLSLSWTYGFSWDKVILTIGTLAERLFYGVRFWSERVKDQRFSKQAVQERANWQSQVAQVPAPIIVPAPSPVVPSARIEKDRQGRLFAEVGSDKLPPLLLLDAAQRHKQAVSPETLEMTSRLIEKKLSDFGVKVQVLLASSGPVVTRYEIEPAAGVKGSQIVNLARDLARALSVVSIRVIETIPGKACMALELPNAQRQSIGLCEILGSQVYEKSKSLLSLALGKDIIGNPVVVDLAKMPHCLVAGTTGSGKSVGINAMLLSLLFKAEAKDVRLLLIDPKMLELSVYEGIPHLLAPVITDMRQAANGLNWCVAEMERRYKLMSAFGVRNIASFNQKLAAAQANGEVLGNPFSLTPESPEPLEHLPFIVVVIDELADLMMVIGKKIEDSIARLAQKARASGIHLVLATQRPSVDVITGLIKANIPTRISFQVSSKIDSRTILDQMGAEALLGMGDMLYMSSGSGLPMRVHGAFVSDDEVHRVVEFLLAQGETNYIEGILEGKVDSRPNELGETTSTGYVSNNYSNEEQDPLYDQAVQVVLKNRKASISLVQRHLKIGYNRSARLLEAMETAGMVSSLSSNGQREILVPNNNEAQQ